MFQAARYTYLLLVLAAGPPLCAQTFSPVSASQFEQPMDGVFGLSVVDVDGDGRADILDAHGVHRQTNTGFEFVPIGPGGAGGMLVGDLNRDAVREVIALTFGGPVPYRYRQAAGDAVPDPSSGLEAFTTQSLLQGSVLFDDNRDGWLDLFLGDDGPPDILLHNQEGTFADVSDQFILRRRDTGTYGAAAADYDNDGDTDLYIGLCREGDGGTRNVLYHRHPGVFDDDTDFFGGGDENPSWGVVWFDYDNDGMLDLFVANMPISDGSVSRPGTNTLFRNVGEGKLEEVGVAAGVAGPANEDSWSAVAADFDNDGWTDLFVANSPEPSRLWKNRGDGTFEDATTAAGLDGVRTVALAAGDLNGDGWVDLATDDGVFLNNGGTNRWLRIQAKGMTSNRDGIGARVEVTAGGFTRIREIAAGEGMMSQSHNLEAHVGLGEAEGADVAVHWPSGEVTTIAGVTARQIVTIVEGEGVNAPPGPFALSAPANGSTVPDPLAITLEWEAAVDPDPVEYTILLIHPDGTESSFETESTSLRVPGAAVTTPGEYRWSVLGADEWTLRSSTERRSFVVSGTVAAEPSPGAVIRIIAGPNPTSGRLSVQAEGAQGPVTFVVYDRRGRRLATHRTIGDQPLHLDLSPFPPGPYAIRFTSDVQTETIGVIRVR